MTKITRADIIAAHGRYYQGKESAPAVAADYGVCRATLYRCFARLNLPVHQQQRVPGRRRITDEEGAVIEALLVDGETFGEIGRRLGRSDNTIRKYAIRTGLAVVQQPRLSAAQDAKIAALYDRRVPVADITVQVGCSVSTVYAALARAGREIRNPAISAARRRYLRCGQSNLVKVYS